MDNIPPTAEAAPDPWLVTELDHERGYKDVDVESKAARKVNLRINALPADQFLEICWTLPEYKVGIEVLKRSVLAETRDWIGALCPFSFSQAMGVSLALARGESAEKKRMEAKASAMRAECSKVIEELSSRFRALESTQESGRSPSSSDGSTAAKAP